MPNLLDGLRHPPLFFLTACKSPFLGSLFDLLLQGPCMTIPIGVDFFNQLNNVLHVPELRLSIEMNIGNHFHYFESTFWVLLAVVKED